MRRLILSGCAILSVSCAVLSADEPPVKVQPQGTTASAAEEIPLNLELKMSGTNAIFAAERDLSKGVTEAGNLKRKAKLAARPVQSIQQEISNLETRMLQAEQQVIQLNAQLAGVDANDVAANNRLVGAINTINGQIGLARKNLEGLTESETQARAELNNAREGFIEHILNMRKMSDQLRAAYESGSASPEIASKLKELIADSRKELKLEPSSAFEGACRKIEEFEKAIHTETISLRRDGNVFYASVVINGKHTAEMVVDSGASMVTLPYDLAVKLGLKPVVGDKQVLLVLADGSKITGHLKTIDAVRVGEFSVEKVDCAILGPEAISAQPLLGMSFLGEFQFQLDAANATLGMTEIEADPRKK